MIKVSYTFYSQTIPGTPCNWWNVDGLSEHDGDENHH